MERKICSKCLIERDVCEFHKHKKTIDGYFSQCKVCRKIKSKNNYFKNKENGKLVITIKTCCSCCVEKNISYFHKQCGSKDGYRSMCKECRAIKFKDNYQNSSEFSREHKKRTKNYRLNNREKVNQYFKDRYIDKPHEYAWRGMLSSVIRRFGGKKELSTYETLGYSAEQLKKHLENLFTEGMSWENWGEWHIDHKIPISCFNKNEDPKVVNSLDNLQPLWAVENIKKSNKIND
jgi:hypothetical protein